MSIPNRTILPDVYSAAYYQTKVREQAPIIANEVNQYITPLINDPSPEAQERVTAFIQTSFLNVYAPPNMKANMSAGASYSANVNITSKGKEEAQPEQKRRLPEKNPPDVPADSPRTAKRKDIAKRMKLINELDPSKRLTAHQSDLDAITDLYASNISSINGSMVIKMYTPDPNNKGKLIPPHWIHVPITFTQSHAPLGQVLQNYFNSLSFQSKPEIKNRAYYHTYGKFRNVSRLPPGNLDQVRSDVEYLGQDFISDIDNIHPINNNLYRVSLFKIKYVIPPSTYNTEGTITETIAPVYFFIKY